MSACRHAVVFVTILLGSWGWLIAVDGAVSPGTVVELPTRSFRKLTVVPVEIGGRDHLNFVLDSGSVATTVNDVEMATMLGLRMLPLGRAEGFGGARLPVFSAPDVEVSSNGTALMRTDLVVHHVAELQEEQAGWALHGLLGADFFLRYAVEIDPVNDRVLLHAPRSPVPFDALAVATIDVHRRRPIVDVKLTVDRGRRTSARLLLDTGAEADVLIVDGAKRRLRAPEDGRRVLVTGIGGQAEGIVAPLALLEIGDLPIGGLDAAFVGRGSMPSSREIRRVDGILGNGVLSRYRCWIDLHAGQLVLGNPDQPAKPEEPGTR
jgi:hypothetical protein